MAPNKRKNAAKKLKKGEELRQALVSALAAATSASSTSPPPSLQVNDNKGPCPPKSQGSYVPNYAQFEDSDEEEEGDEEVGSHSCMEDEASASKFFFTSPMSHKGDEACLLMHESHAHFNAQEGEGAAEILGSGTDGNPFLLLEGVDAAAVVGRGEDGIPPLQLSAHPLPSPSTLKNHVGCGDVVSETPKSQVGCCGAVLETLVKGKENVGAVTLSVGTVPLAVPSQSSPSKFHIKEHDGLTVAPARGKEKLGADAPSNQLSAAAGGTNGGCSSSSHAKEMFTSSPANDKVASAPITAKVVEAVEKGLVKRWVPVKKVIPDQVKPIEQQLSDEPYRPTNCEEPSRPTNCEEAFRPTNCGEHFRPNDMQVSSPLNESLDEQRVDPMQMETDAGEWTIVKRRNGKSKVANDNAVVVSSLGDPASMVGIDVDPLCGVTTRSGIRRSGDLARSKGLKALAPVHLC
ncbi:hypothetical protein OIU78_029913 [Salix suchowensis]|nr:hypothetical protein OIU78_029913 [Salix suchowensis]